LEVANYLLLQILFTRKQKFTRLSLLTKLPEYLATSRPIIAITPRNSAIWNYFKNYNNYNCGLLINNINKNFIQQKILCLIDNEVDNILYVKNAINTVQLLHNIKNEQIKFYNLLISSN
jgi:hypothetical protein